MRLGVFSMAAAVVACISAVSSSANAEQVGPATQSQLAWSLGPRVWFLSDSMSLHGSGPNSAFTRSNAHIPMVGFNLHLLLPRADVTISVLNGSGQVDMHNVALRSGIASESKWEFQQNRTDIEVMAQTRFSGGTSHWIVGARAEVGRSSHTASTRTLTPAGVVEAASSGKSESEVYTVKFGLASSTSIIKHGTEDGPHRLFANVMGLGGVEFVRSAFEFTQYRVGTDASVGYQYQINKHVAVDMRYRFLANYIMHTPGGKNTLLLTHGPMFSGTIKW